MERYFWQKIAKISGSHNSAKIYCLPMSETMFFILRQPNQQNFCQKNSAKVCCLQNFSRVLIARGSVGGLVDKATPMICGGDSNQCYKLDTGAWQMTSPMLRSRYFFAGIPFSPFHNSSHKFFVLGYISRYIHVHRFQVQLNLMCVDLTDHRIDMNTTNLCGAN